SASPTTRISDARDILCGVRTDLSDVARRRPRIAERGRTAYRDARGLLGAALGADAPARAAQAGGGGAVRTTSGRRKRFLRGAGSASGGRETPARRDRNRRGFRRRRASRRRGCGEARSALPGT